MPHETSHWRDLSPPPKESVDLPTPPSAGLPQRLRAIPVWMVGKMTPGWQDHGTTAYHAADYIERLEAALKQSTKDLRTVGDDYPGSSCQQWCQERANVAAQAIEASVIASMRPKDEAND